MSPRRSYPTNSLRDMAFTRRVTTTARYSDNIQQPLGPSTDIYNLICNVVYILLGPGNHLNWRYGLNLAFFISSPKAFAGRASGGMTERYPDFAFGWLTCLFGFTAFYVSFSLLPPHGRSPDLSFHVYCSTRIPCTIPNLRLIFRSIIYICTLALHTDGDGSK
ncbi:hypothetical protein F4677DRAFT_57231 [Hypoxylon crocopeplum]|nr:hypothetical protein F4677DRAFT_57231 [Hypoxylon crocopeplum]